MLSMVEMPSVTFSPDSAGIRKTKLKRVRSVNSWTDSRMSYRAMMLMRTAGWM